MLCARVSRSVPRHFLHNMKNVERMNEVVEDSEPEREVLRQLQRLERKKKKLEISSGESSAAAEKLSGPSRVIEISDSSLPASPSADSFCSRRSPVAIGVIEISDSNTNTSSFPNAHNNHVLSIHSSTVGSEPALAQLPPCESGHSDEEILPTLNLVRFAFTNPRPLQHRYLSSTAGSTSGVNAQTEAQAKKAPGGAAHRFAGDFSDNELKKLVKCVSCDASWTARKSVAQKMTHIQSCAKKNGLIDDTVRILIRKELANAPVDTGPPKQRGKTAVLAEPAAPNTLLHDVVQDAAPKRRGKRKETIETLKSVSVAHQNILGRARTLLGPAPSSNDDDFIPQTQAFGPSSLGSARLAQTTEPGGLAQLNGEADVPPATQTFAPSKLGGRMITGVSCGWGYESDSDSPMLSRFNTPNVSPERSSNNQPTTPSSAKEGSPRSSPKRKGETNARNLPPFPAPLTSARVESSGWHDDDAYMHFDPELNKETLSDENRVVPSQKPKKNSGTTHDGKGTRSPKTKRRTQVIAVADDPDALLQPVTPKKKRSKKKPGEQPEEFDEQWERELKDKIMRDLNLHLRILRYEPINFDVFLQLASDKPPYSGRLKFKLRVFLDKQAINFYGGEAGWRR
ncbi:hypothetical protein B0H10DRAFT_98116 [Mycena sp. CBHHK59/15]|nr:hypothetical protein B0H10DRAFT_98116 [Mycena sp. CBHHK59/15]